MLNIKSIMSIVLLFFFTSQSIINNMELPKNRKNPGLELYNKSYEPITMSLFINNQFITTTDINPHEIFFTKIDLDKAITISVYDQITEILTDFGPETTIAPTLYTFNAPGKTKYLIYNPTKKPSLFPQKKNFFQSRKSYSGFSLKNNITINKQKIKNRFY